MTTVDDAELAARLRALTLEQKVRLLTGADIWALHPEPGVGLRQVVTSDGPAGVRGQSWDERFPSANIPSPTALAASWDADRLERMGRLLAAEARRKGVDVLLAPTVNLHRSPYGGRHFECLSEDPLLSAVLGAAYVRGVQGGGVAATVKHFVANDAETDRFTVDVRVGERALREVYLRPFEAAVEAGAWAVMAAYNSVNGVTMTENPLLRDVLKDEWGFDGVVMSDWYAARSPAAAGAGLLDLAMPGPDGPWGEALLAAVRAGEVTESSVDDHVLRVLRLAARVGALAGLPPAAPAARPLSDVDIAAELRAAASAGFVLASNRESVLPLDLASLTRIAVLGPGAAAARTMGGGSATVFPPYTVTPLDGLRAAVGTGVEVVHVAGGRVTERLPVAPPDQLALPDGSAPGVDVRLLGADGTLLGQQHRRAASLLWWGPIQPDLDASQVDRVQLRTLLRVPQDGHYSLGASGLGHLSLSLDGRTVLDTAVALRPGADVVEGFMRPPQRQVDVYLTAGQDAAVLLTYRPARATSLGGTVPSILAVALNLAPRLDDQAEFDRAVAVAATADAAVVVVGTTEEVESEGFDRDQLALPGRQDDLVRAVAAANPRTVVVVNAGAPVLLPWADEVAAVLLAWFGGQELGNALADVLLGQAEPGGRLPTTWPTQETGHPSVAPVDGRLDYDEGLFVGYRGYDRDGRTPRYPFGHGLGYTDWAYQSVSIPDTAQPGEDVTATVAVTNTGHRPGREVIQVYASKPDSAVPRPVRWLAGFATVDARPAQTVQATVTLPARAFQHWDPATGWTTEPGVFRLDVGRSVGNLLRTAEFTMVAAEPPAPGATVTTGPVSRP
jgi:beta-glucosidase